MFQKYFFITIYCLLLSILTTYFFLFNWYEYVLCLVSSDESLTEFDYIIVGAGTAGSVVALRLSQDPTNKVLLLEAGPYGNSEILDIPCFAPLLHKSVYDWQYKTIPQENACWAFENNSSSWPTGKIFGGSGRLNHMLYTRGHPDDFKEWYKDVPDFDYERDILYYFKKSEHQAGYLSNDSVYHGTGGPLTATDLVYHSDLYESIIKAARALKLPIRDINGEFSSGLSPPQVNIRNSNRYSTGHHLLKHRTPNLTIRTLAVAKEIIFKSNFEAHGVIYERLGKDFKVFAKNGVIITSGTVGSAKLLMLSGIGPKDHLQKIGIKPKIDLPVGENLQDHVSTGFDLVLFDKSLDIHLNLISPIEAFKYIFFGTGILTSVGLDILAFLNTYCLDNLQNFLSYEECEAEFNDRPNVEFLFLQAGVLIDFGIRMKHVVGIKEQIWKEYYSKFLDSHTVSFIPIVLRPKSAGYMRLKDKNMDSKPIINPNYLSHKDDIDILVSGIKFVKKLVETEPMQKLGARFNNIPFPTCEKYKFATNTYWKCYIKHMSFTLYHPVGTCKMGPENDENTVVTRNFNVKGTNKLFVADASVIPQLISANTNAAVAMLAEKAVDSIKTIQYLSKGTCVISEVFIIKTFC